jgi:hypothetical protein
MINPVAGLDIKFRCANVIFGINNPFVVLCTCNWELASGVAGADADALRVSFELS